MAMVEEPSFLVIMDLPNAQAGHMPRRFYRALKKLQDVERLQKSVYLVTSVTVARELVNLGRDNGFQVQAFQVIKNGHICDIPRGRTRVRGKEGDKLSRPFGHVVPVHRSKLGSTVIASPGAKDSVDRYMRAVFRVSCWDCHRLNSDQSPRGALKHYVPSICIWW